MRTVLRLLRTRLSLAVFCLIALVAVVETNAQSTPASNPVSPLTLDLAVQWLPQSQFAGYYMARDKGFYRDSGLNVRIHHADAQTSSLDLLLAGKVDLATSFLADALIANARIAVASVKDSGKTTNVGSGIVQLAQIVNRSNLMLVAWKELGIRTATDIDGKRISYWPGSFSSTYEAFFLDRGIRPSKIPQYYSVNLFLKKGVAACAAMEYNEYHRILQTGVDPDRLTVFLMRDYGLGFPEDGIYASASWAAAHPDSAVAVRTATLKGWEYARTHSAEAIDAVVSEAHKAGVPVNRAHEQWMLSHILDSIFLPDTASGKVGSLSRSDFEAAATALRATGLLVRAPAYEDFAPIEGKAR